jgi:Uma2 family endonuclease
MRAVVVHLREEELADRRSKGLDRWDEMWEGVLHTTPAPSLEHQRILSGLIEFLRPYLRKTGRGTLLPGINVFNERSAAPDYRIPDLTFVAAGREHILQQDGVRGEGPDAVIEIRSPEDETYDKLPFYAALAMSEIIVCQRDSKEPEIFRLAGSQYFVLQPDRDGWLTSSALGLRLRRVGATPPRLRIEDTADPSVSVEL